MDLFARKNETIGRSFTFIRYQKKCIGRWNFGFCPYLSTFLKSDDMRIILSALLLILTQSIGAQTTGENL